MRARNIKPGFFKNEDLAECDLSARLLFIGLWCLADREGRLEYRPRKIKAEVFPYDNFSMEKLIKQLVDKNFIQLYTVNSQNYILILNFNKHQNCRVKEQPSTIPAPCLSGVDNQPSTIQAALNPESPLLNPEPPLLNMSDDFLEFWKLYPNKTEKKYTWKCWQKLNGTRPPIELLLAAIRKQIEWRKNANGEFRAEWKNPATWLNKGCWDDEPTDGGNSNGRITSGTGKTCTKAGGAQSDGTPWPADREY